MAWCHSLYILIFSSTYECIHSFTFIQYYIHPSPFAEVPLDTILIEPFIKKFFTAILLSTSRVNNSVRQHFSTIHLLSCILKLVKCSIGIPCHFHFPPLERTFVPCQRPFPATRHVTLLRWSYTSSSGPFDDYSPPHGCPVVWSGRRRLLYMSQITYASHFSIQR